MHSCRWRRVLHVGHPVSPDTHTNPYCSTIRYHFSLSYCDPTGTTRWHNTLAGLPPGCSIAVQRANNIINKRIAGLLRQRLRLRWRTCGAARGLGQHVAGHDKPCARSRKNPQQQHGAGRPWPRAHLRVPACTSMMWGSNARARV
jgi:hypothetical protein